MRQSNSWIADLPPSFPLHQVTRAAWASTAAYVAISSYTTHKKDANDILILPLRDNLHWSTHSTNGNAIMTPVDMASKFPSFEQLAHAA